MFRENRKFSDQSIIDFWGISKEQLVLIHYNLVDDLNMPKTISSIL